MEDKERLIHLAKLILNRKANEQEEDEFDALKEKLNISVTELMELTKVQ